MKPFTMLILFALFSCAPSITGKQAPPDQLYMEIHIFSHQNGGVPRGGRSSAVACCCSFISDHRRLPMYRL